MRWKKRMAKFITPKKNRIYLETFTSLYPKFAGGTDSPEFKLIFQYLVQNIDKMIWAIEDLNKPPLEGIGKRLVELNPDLFENPDIRRMTGALIAAILNNHGYVPESSGSRVSWSPFVTSSKYRKK